MVHPILAEFGPFTLYTYGFFLAMGAIAAYLLCYRMAVIKKVPVNTVGDLILILFVSGVVGSRLFYVFQNTQEFISDPARILRLNEGGLIWYGGFITAAFLGMVYARIKKLPLLFLCDFFSPALALGHGIGRLGCFFNGCCHGLKSGTFLDVDFGYPVGQALPTQIYESAFLIVLAIFLYRQFVKTTQAGAIFSQYVIFYASFRFALEFYRSGQPVFFYLTHAQWTSLILLLGALVFYFKKVRRV